MTTAQKFYRQAAFAPYVVLIATVATTYLARGVSADSAIVHVAAPVALIAYLNIWAVVPYSIYLAVLWFFWRPDTESEHRQRAFISPVLIAVPVGMAMQLVAGFKAARIEKLSGLWIYGTAALVVGYVYVLCIELALLLAKQLDYIAPQSA